jgi:hypothetical protein
VNVADDVEPETAASVRILVHYHLYTRRSRP